MQLLQSSLKVFLLIGMAFWLAGCLPEAEEEPVVASVPATNWYHDVDGDGHGDGDPLATVFFGDDPNDPDDPLAWVDNNTDCDDNNANANPDELEVPDRVDNNCDVDGKVDEGYKYVFVTSTTHNGNLGGLTGADATCNDLAADVTAPLPLPAGNYVAWLSSLEGNAIDRVTDDPDNMSTYVFTDGIPGTVIADGFRNLIKGTTAININELMGGVGGMPHVWTDTDVLGMLFHPGASCLDWTSGNEGHHDSNFGYFGNAGPPPGSTWTLANFDECENAKRLYCIQY